MLTYCVAFILSREFVRKPLWGIVPDACRIPRWVKFALGHGGRTECLLISGGVYGAISRLDVGFRETTQKASRIRRHCRRACYPVLAKHSNSFSPIDCISVGVDRMQRNFEPMRKQVESWQRSELTDVTAKVVIYEAFVESRLEAPKHLARTVHNLYFEPKYEEF
jgi:hypothetical protein